MHSEDKLFAIFWCLLAAVIITIAVTIGVCSSTLRTTEVNAMKDMVAKGADPMRAACALNQATFYCTTLAAR